MVKYTLRKKIFESFNRFLGVSSVLLVVPKTGKAEEESKHIKNESTTRFLQLTGLKADLQS